MLDDSNRKSIAVLPFDSFSDNTQDEHFADGLSEQLLHVLASVKELRVSARTSSFEYKNADINIKTIAQRLGVQYILEGSVRRSGETLRVTAQLINASDDSHLFSKVWDRDFEDLFTIQDEIANLVLQELKVQLLGESPIGLEYRGTENLDAFAEYSKGQGELRKRTAQSFEAAINSFQQAIEFDNRYAEAYAGLAESYLLQASYKLVEPGDAQQAAWPALETALGLNPELADVHAVMGLYLWQKSGHSDEKENLLDKAQVHLAKAMDINQSYAEAYMWYGSILQQKGQWEQGTQFHKKAYELDPQSRVAGYNYGQDLLWQGNYQSAMRVFNALIRTDPNYPNAYNLAADVSYNVGQLDQAFSLYLRAAELAQDDRFWPIQSIRLLIVLGLYDEASSQLARLKDKKTSEQYFMQLFDLEAMLLMAQGKQDEFIQLTQQNWPDLEDETHKYNKYSMLAGQSFWRGVAAMMQNNSKQGVEFLSSALDTYIKLKKQKKKYYMEQEIRTQLMLARAHQLVGDYVKANTQLDHAVKLLDKRKADGFNHHYLTYFYSSLAAMKGDTDEALRLFNQAVQEGWTDVWMAKVDPTFDNIRGDSVFTNILAGLEAQISIMRRQVLKQQASKFALK
nr:tetratricopeptide repeat protein [Pleionea sp. CnH1-48]